MEQQINIPACIEHRGWFILINDEGFDLFDRDKVQIENEATTIQEVKNLIDRLVDEAIEKYSDINDDEYYRGRPDRFGDDL